MKRWMIILASVFALLILVVTPLTISAQGQTNVTTAARPKLKGALAIVAPWVVRPGEEMSLTVFLRRDQSTVANVGIWGVTKDQAETIRAAIRSLRNKNGTNAPEADYQAILNSNGNLIGRTNENGKLTHTFNAPGHLLLIAFKAEYASGFMGFSVRQVLAVSAPKKASPGEGVTVTVNQKGTTNPISGAAVWQAKWANAQALKDALSKARSNNKENTFEASVVSVLSAQAIPLGKTEVNGQISTKLNNSGRYLLIATKDGCVPGFSSIVLAGPQPEVSAAVTPIPMPNSNGKLK